MGSEFTSHLKKSTSDLCCVVLLNSYTGVGVQEDDAS